MTFVRFFLIVTGRGEYKFLHSLFRAIAGAAHCTFEVLRKSDQLKPRTSAKRTLRMVGRGQTIPTIDEEQYGLPARLCLQRYGNSFVIVIDDLEGDRRNQVNAVFARYREALDQMLSPYGLAHRASVHFLVNMLEAYYFANSHAVNTAAARIILQADHPVDVETITHPKSELKRLWSEFKEIEHGEAVVAQLDLHHVLQIPTQCCWLRSLFAWCIERLPVDAIWDPQLNQSFQLATGCKEPLTYNQSMVGTPAT